MTDASSDEPRLPPLLVFSDDWGRHPSSCQHLIGCLLHKTQVVWINTIGMRAPSLDQATLRRGFAKMGGWMGAGRASRTDQSNPQVESPRMWPWFRSRLDRTLNRTLLLRHLEPVIRTLTEPPVAITTIPIVADLIGRLPVRHWSYYCVDDFTKWPGLDAGPLQRMEEQVVERADRLIAVSEVLQDRLRNLGREAPLLTHGVDLDHWRAVAPVAATLPVLDALPRPLVVFWGVIDARMDISFLQALSADLQAGTILLVGPQEGSIAAIRGIPRVVLHGSVPYAALPVLASEASVLIMPYADLPVTRAMQPLKLKEYLATGKPAVVRDLPSTRPWADCLDVAATPSAFSAAVRERLQVGVSVTQQKARGRLGQETWQTKSEAFARLVIEQPRPIPVSVS